jgi:transcriptional regulator with XRE-family HTH domain
MNNYESGKNWPDTDTIIKIAQYLNCSTDYLFGLSTFRTQKEQTGYANKLEEISYYLSAPHPQFGEIYLATFLSLAKCIYKDAIKKPEFGFRVQVIVLMIVQLIDHSIETRDKQESGLLTEDELKIANHKRQQIIHQLRIEIGDLHNISYNYINNLLDTNE